MVDPLTDAGASGSARRRRLANVLRLRSVPGLGRARAARWTASEGGPEGALRRARREVGEPALTPAQAEAELDRLSVACRTRDIRVVAPGDPEYPRRFDHLPDPPSMLFVRGQPAAFDETVVAVVGSRRATSYGRRVARDLGRGLGAAGITVVSGLARGIDAEAHRGALEAGARTVAVLGRGPDRAYPAGHAPLMRELLRDGAVWSEYAPGVGPRQHHFPERNRLIAGAARAVVVVEAAERSGALITARLGLEAGVDVWAVPGRIDERSTVGVHGLLRDGARPVCALQEVVDVYAPGSAGDEGRDATRRPAGVSDVAVEVWTHLGDGPADLDTLAARWADPFPGSGPVLAALAELEVEGWVTRTAGALWARRAA